MTICCGSIEHYQEVIEKMLDAQIGIDKYFSYIVIKTPIMKSSVPLRSLIAKHNSMEFGV